MKCCECYSLLHFIALDFIWMQCNASESYFRLAKDVKVEGKIKLKLNWNVNNSLVVIVMVKWR